MKISMRKLVYCIMVLAVVFAGCNSKGGVETATAVAEKDGYNISAEDSAGFIEVFEDYLSYSKEYADSAAKKAGQIPLGERPADPEAEAYYHQNKVHGDSLMHQCISLVKQKDYKALLGLLQAERANIYLYPGNKMDNELNLGWIVETLCKQEYNEREDSFYVNMLPWYEFSVLHMEMLMAFGKGEHPEYESTLIVLALAYEKTGNDEKLVAALQKIADIERGNLDNQYYIASMIRMSRAYERMGRTESRDSCIDAVKFLHGYQEME